MVHVSSERTDFYVDSGEIPLPRSCCSFLASLRYASAGTCGERSTLIRKFRLQNDNFK